MRGRHEQNKKRTNNKVTWCLVNFWCTPCRSHRVSATKVVWSISCLFSTITHPHRVLIEMHPEINLPFKKTWCAYWPCQVQKTIPLHT
jgi:hypothetical protein